MSWGRWNLLAQFTDAQQRLVQRRQNTVFSFPTPTNMMSSAGVLGAKARPISYSHKPVDERLDMLLRFCFRFNFPT